MGKTSKSMTESWDRKLLWQPSNHPGVGCKKMHQGTAAEGNLLWLEKGCHILSAPKLSSEELQYQVYLSGGRFQD
jgi:hypothetical protein